MAINPSLAKFLVIGLPDREFVSESKVLQPLDNDVSALSVEIRLVVLI
jgi:hypothetical protein